MFPRMVRSAWLRWLMLAPLLGVYAEGSCVSNTLRDVADQIDGDQQTDLDQLVNDLDNLFD
jgi:hypothetical protein